MKELADHSGPIRILSLAHRLNLTTQISIQRVTGAVIVMAFICQHRNHVSPSGTVLPHASPRGRLCQKHVADHSNLPTDFSSFLGSTWRTFRCLSSQLRSHGVTKFERTWPPFRYPFIPGRFFRPASGFDGKVPQLRRTQFCQPD